MKILYKVLDEDLKSPFKKFQYEIGKDYFCENFNTKPEMECSKGFYATDWEGIIYSMGKKNRIYEVMVWGKEVETDRFKRRYENIRIIREINETEVKQNLKRIEKQVGYNICEMVYPVNPFDIKAKKVTDREIELLKEWSAISNFKLTGSVRFSVEESIMNSDWKFLKRPTINYILYSIRDSILEKIIHSMINKSYYNCKVNFSDFLYDSVTNFIMAYISSNFYGIKEWKYIEYNSEGNPFQCAIDLWKSGFVISFDGFEINLHSGKDAKIVYSEKC